MALQPTLRESPDSLFSVFSSGAKGENASHENSSQADPSPYLWPQPGFSSDLKSLETWPPAESAPHPVIGPPVILLPMG